MQETRWRVSDLKVTAQTEHLPCPVSIQFSNRGSRFTPGSCSSHHLNTWSMGKVTCLDTKSEPSGNSKKKSSDNDLLLFCSEDVLI